VRYAAITTEQAGHRLMRPVSGKFAMTRGTVREAFR
jgi:hypothetical protein